MGKCAKRSVGRGNRKWRTTLHSAGVQKDRVEEGQNNHSWVEEIGCGAKEENQWGDWHWGHDAGKAALSGEIWCWCATCGKKTETMKVGEGRSEGADKVNAGKSQKVKA